MKPHLPGLFQDMITLVKLNGEVIENIPATCDPTLFFIDDSSIIIEEGDFFERSLSNGAKEYYRVTDPGFFESSLSTTAHYQTKVARTNKSDVMSVLDKNNLKECNMKKKTNKLFISHSSNDKAYMKAFVELLEDIGMPDGTIVCTSVPGHGIPGGARIYDWLREQFTSCNLRVVFALSKNYYNSPASLNEMGAAWVTKATDTLLLLPGFDFKDIKGCIDPTEVGIRLEGDDEELKHRLNELKNTLISEFSLSQMSDTRWERHRNGFIEIVRGIAKETKFAISDSAANESEDYVPISTSDSEMPKHIPVESAFLIVYAAVDGNGEIYRSQTLSGVDISTARKTFMKDNSAREAARWQGALDNLVSWKWVRCVGKKEQLFLVTDLGYEMADFLKDEMKIDVNRDPLNQLQDFI